MYSTIESFIADYTNESASTTSIFRSLTDAALGHKVTAEGRSLGFLAWHIVLTLGEMGSKAGLAGDGPAEDAPAPASASALLSTYESASRMLLQTVQARWTDDSLKEEIPMYGETWTRGGTLTALVKHEIHHRAQMTVLMRQAGLRVPGVYGPSREEWVQFGMPAPR